MTEPDAKRKRTLRHPSLLELIGFALFSGLFLLFAVIADTGRVAYTLIMLVIAAALAYAILDIIEYEIAKKKRRG